MGRTALYIRVSESHNCPVFELRIYTFNIRGMSDYMRLLDRHFWSLRTSFSQVLGPWKTELNGLCEVVHIAQYDSLTHLLASRKKMGADPDWNKEIMKIADLQMTFKNILAVLAPHCHLETGFQPSDQAVYELQTLPEGAMNSGTELGPRPTVVGRFLSLYGPSKTEYRLLRYPDPDSAFAGALLRRSHLPEGSSTRLMVPVHVSNLH